MAVQRRPIQDQRYVSRITTHISCKLTFEGVAHEAFIRDVSLTGAFLWQTIVPPKGTHVSIKLEASSLDRPLILEGMVVRSDCKNTDRGTVGAFAVTFSNSSPEFIRLISKLSHEGCGVETQSVSMDQIR
jgi:hypothetical protein